MMRKDESDLQHGDVCEIVQKDNGVLRKLGRARRHVRAR